MRLAFGGRDPVAFALSCDPLSLMANGSHSPTGAYVGEIGDKSRSSVPAERDRRRGSPYVVKGDFGHVRNERLSP